MLALLTETPWIDWPGGDNPAGKEYVEVRLRDGSPICAYAQDFRWNHKPVEAYDRARDIVAYRVLGGPS